MDKTRNNPYDRGGQGRSHAPGVLINLNHASVQDLMAMGMPEATAAELVRRREARGGFDSWHDFDEPPSRAPGDDVTTFRPGKHRDHGRRTFNA